MLIYKVCNDIKILNMTTSNRIIKLNHKKILPESISRILGRGFIFKNTIHFVTKLDTWARNVSVEEKPIHDCEISNFLAKMAGEI